MTASAPPRKVLIVDDDADSADALALLFSLQGFDAAVARGGRAGFAAVDAMRPDAVVTDIRMPSLDGHALARSLQLVVREARPFLIAYTGIGESDPRYEEFRGAFDLWFTKPAGLGAVVAAVGDLIDRRRQLAVSRQPSGNDVGPSH